MRCPCKGSRFKVQGLTREQLVVRPISFDMIDGNLTIVLMLPFWICFNILLAVNLTS